MTAGKRRASAGWLARRWYPVHRHPRLMVCALLFAALTIALLLGGIRTGLAILLAFDAAAVIFLAATALMFLRSDMRSIRGRARQEDEGYWGFLLSSATVAAVALVALAEELHVSKHAGGLQIALAVGSLVVAWTFMNTIFALHYAHEFYADHDGKHPGLDFPGDVKPDYWDFVYFAFVLGMTFQVSDVEIRGRRIRHVALAHSVIAFFFNVIVIALSVNIVAGSA